MCRLRAALAVLSAFLVLGCSGCQSSRTGGAGSHEPPPAGAGATGASSPGGGQVVEVLATDYAFEPKEVVVEPGQRVVIRLVNQGSHRHNIKFVL